MFPLKKSNVYLENSQTKFLSDYKDSTEIPINPHPGSFGKKRKNHVHEGIDLYCEKGDLVYNIEDGTVIKIKSFTGEENNSPWWNNTWCVLIEGKTGVFNYGEIIPEKNIKEGLNIKEGQIIGTIETVLKKNKGRPMNMLHLELYNHGTKDSIEEWGLEEAKPVHLLDPTHIIIELSKI